MSIATGCCYTVVLNQDGRLFCSGNNINGCLSQGTRAHQRRFVSVAVRKKNTRFTAVKAGMQHWLALDEDGKLWGCGSNFHGQLGLGQETLETLSLSPVSLRALAGQRVRSVAAGLAHCLLCTTESRVFAAGCNTEGQLGTGDFVNRSEFVAVHEGSQTPKCRASSVAAGGWHSLAVDPDGGVWTWGSVIGTPPTYLAEGGVDRARAAVPGRFPTQTFGLEQVFAVAAGHCHSIALTASAVFSWGDGSRGCLGQGHYESLALPAPIHKLAGCATTSVACGPYHNIATHGSGRASVWGNNNRGQLGLGDLIDRSIPALLPAHLLHHERIMEVSAGVEHCGAVTANGALYTWGRCRADGREGSASARAPCGLGVASSSQALLRPERVAALFDRAPPGRAGPQAARVARLGRWHGVSMAHALAWLMGTRPPRRAETKEKDHHHRPARVSARLACRAKQCWVSALPPDIVQLILEQCRGLGFVLA